MFHVKHFWIPSASITLQSPYKTHIKDKNFSLFGLLFFLFHIVNI